MTAPAQTLPTRSLWHDRRFRTFWSAQGVSEFGDRISELALPLIAVTMLNASPSQVGFLTAAVWLPNLASLFIGTWVDQHRDKRPLMIAADLSRTVLLLSLPAAYWLDVLTLGQLYAIAILAGTAHVVFNTAYASFFVRLVSREQYLEAGSKLAATRSISFMAGPAAGGLLVQWLTAPIALIVDALSFAFSAVQVSRLKVPPGDTELDEESFLARARAGMRYLLRHPYLRVSLGCATTVNFFNMIGMALLVLFASRNLGTVCCEHRCRLRHRRVRRAGRSTRRQVARHADRSRPAHRDQLGRFPCLARDCGACQRTDVDAGKHSRGRVLRCSLLGDVLRRSVELPAGSRNPRPHAKPSRRRLQQHQLRSPPPRRSSRRPPRYLARSPPNPPNLRSRRPLRRPLANPLPHNPHPRPGRA